MAKPRRRPSGIGLTVMAMVVVGLRLGPDGLRRARAEAGDDGARQVTVFAILAKPGSKAVDSKLASIEAQLNRLLPHHGFKLLDAQSKPLVAGESVVSDLGHAY